MTEMTGENDATGTILHVVSKSGGLAHGRKPDGGLGSKSGGLAHGSGAVEALGSKSGGLAHGRGLDEGLGSKSGGLAHGSWMGVSGANLAVWRTGGARWRPS